MNKKTAYITCGLCGLINGMFGSGGGMLAVPLFEHSGYDKKKSHAMSVAFIFAVSTVSASAYYFSGRLDISLALQFIPYGLIGSIIGSLWLKKISSEGLKLVFAVIVLLGGIRMLFG